MSEDRLEQVMRDTLDLLTNEQRVRVWQIKWMTAGERMARDNRAHALEPDPRFFPKTVARRARLARRNGHGRD